MTNTRVSDAERLVNLILALLDTRQGLTKQEIKDKVTGYVHTSGDSFERRFSRDKNLLRELKITIETTETVYGEYKYRINPSSNQGPELYFNHAELGVLSLAAKLWGDPQLLKSTWSGLTKLLGQGISDPLDPAEEHEKGPDVAADAANLGVSKAGLFLDESLWPAAGEVLQLLKAIQGQQEVIFDYWSASTGVTAKRRVQPWAVVLENKAWYLHAFDVEKQAARTYKLTRLRSSVKLRGKGSFVVNGPEQQVKDKAEAVIRIRPGKATRLRASFVGPLAGQQNTGLEAGVKDVAPLPGEATADFAGWDTATVTAPSQAELVTMLASYGPDVMVLAPANIRAAVISILGSALQLGEQ